MKQSTRHTPASLSFVLGWNVTRVHEEAGKLATELGVTATPDEAFVLLAGLAEEEELRAVERMNAGGPPPPNRPGKRVATTVGRRFFHAKPVKGELEAARRGTDAKVARALLKRLERALAA